MKKQFTSLLLASTLVLSSLISGCSGKKVENDVKDDVSEGDLKPYVESTMKLPIVDEKMDLSALVVLKDNIEDINTNFATQWMEKETNIHMNWITVTAKDAKEKVSKMLASGSDLPDILLGDGVVDKELQYVYGSKGVLLPLNPLIERYAVETRNIFIQEPEFKKQLTAPDGNIYALGSYDLDYLSTFNQRMYINKPWLDRMNLDIPKTTDAFYNMLKAFKDRDPNGNGKADEIPLSGYADANNIANRSIIDGFIMNAFIYNNGMNRLNMVNNKIVPAFAQPEWKEGLAYLNKLYKEGLIDTEAFTQDNSKLKQLVDGGTIRLGAAPASSQATLGTVGKGKPAYDFVALAPIKGPKGNNTAASYPAEVTEGRFAITKACKNPEVAIRWIDYAMTELSCLILYYGEPGVDWMREKEGDKDMYGNKAYWSELDAVRLKSKQNKTWNNVTPRYGSGSVIHGKAVPSDPFAIESIMYNDTKLYEAYPPKQIVPSLFYDAQNASVQNELKSKINNYVKESITEFITGKLNLESDWDKYLKELKNLGLDKYVENAQKAYDRQYLGVR